MKRSVSSNLKEAAKILGASGGRARDRRLTKGQRQSIARQGGEAKARKMK